MTLWIRVFEVRSSPLFLRSAIGNITDNTMHRPGLLQELSQIPLPRWLRGAGIIIANKPKNG